ncbi:MAG: DNA polymerase III subunit delta [Hyphomicrobiales bacterium]|nr:DNA polymerase III subunit delta [Hyphomicrobiales bacterium]MDE2113889.1 DNA polymerase III subunit delta [Hyphomicrobiales bacterium]
MVAIAPRDIDRLLSQPPKNFWAYLVYGEDVGLVSERAGHLVKRLVSDPKDPFLVERMDGNAIADDPMPLLDAANTIPMFGGTRALRIEQGTKSLVPALEMLFRAPPQDCAIIIEAGSLKKDAPLRKLIESHADAAAIPCYSDSERDVIDLIGDMARESGLAIDPGTAQSLAQMLGADRLSTRSELDKLKLFAHGRSEITLDDIDSIIVDTSTLKVEAAINAAFSGDALGLDMRLRRLFSTGGEANTLLARLLHHAITLHRARLDVDNGKSVTAAAELCARMGLGNTVKGSMERQINQWKGPALAQLVERIHMATLNARAAPALAEANATRLMWNIARQSGAR